MLVTDSIFQVFKERAIQLKFNEAERKKQIQKDLETAQAQNRETKRYKKQQMDEKQRNNKLKRSKAEMLLKEYNVICRAIDRESRCIIIINMYIYCRLKEREDKRSAEQIALRESGKVELQKIAEEIEEAREKAAVEVWAVLVQYFVFYYKYESFKINNDYDFFNGVYTGVWLIKAQIAKEKLQKDTVDNHIMIISEDSVRETEEWEEEMITSIMAETKKILARARRLKEIEVSFVLSPGYR